MGRSLRIKPVRRIITGHDAHGQSIILDDAPSPHAMTMAGVDNFGCTDVWKTTGTPDNNSFSDPCSLPVTLAPPEGGTVLRLVEFPPDNEYVGKWNAEAAFASLGKSGAEAVSKGSTRHEGMHTTKSVDYAIVMEGEIWAVLDKTETLMSRGDVLIQRGTSHAWSNRTNESCCVAFVLIDALPL